METIYLEDTDKFDELLDALRAAFPDAIKVELVTRVETDNPTIAALVKSLAPVQVEAEAETPAVPEKTVKSKRGGKRELKIAGCRGNPARQPEAIRKVKS